MSLRSSYLFHLSVSAQDSENISLRTILEDLEDRYEVSFTYVDQDINGKFLQSPSTDLSLNETIQYLENKTGLDFQQLNDRFITISKDSKDKIKICGVLVDRKNNGTIHGATIQGPKKFTISNENGSFELTELTERDTILVRYLGYEYLIKLHKQSYCQLVKH